MIDIVAACVYMATYLQAWVAVIVFITLFSYIPLTIFLTEWRSKFRRCAACAGPPAGALWDLLAQTHARLWVASVGLPSTFGVAALLAPVARGLSATCASPS